MIEIELGIIEELSRPSLTKEARETIIKDYFPIRMAFEDFLKNGEHIEPRKLMGIFKINRSYWKRESDVKTPLGVVTLRVGTLEVGSYWEEYSDDISNSRIDVTLSKDNETNGTEDRFHVLELYSMNAARDPHDSYVDLEEVQEITRRLKPLVDLMKEQELV